MFVPKPFVPDVSHEYNKKSYEMCISSLRFVKSYARSVLGALQCRFLIKTA